MAVCPQCGATVAEDVVVCDACNALVAHNTANKTISPDERQVELSTRLQKALRRTELLSYAAVGLALAIFAVIIIISFF